MTTKFSRFLIAVKLLMILSLFNCTTNKIETGWKEYKLNGKVKSFTEITYDAIEKFGKIEKGDKRKSFIVVGDLRMDSDQMGWLMEWMVGDNVSVRFDEKGNKIKENHYYSDEKLKWAETYEYDDEGRMIESYYHSERNNFDTKSFFIYDNKRNKIEENCYESDGSLVVKFLYKYDSKGRLEVEKEYSSNGSLDYENIYKYENNGRLIEYVRYDYMGNFQGMSIEKYDAKGFLYEKHTTFGGGPTYSTINGDGTFPIVKYVYEYDSNGRLVAVKYNRGHSKIICRECFFDEDGTQPEQLELIEDSEPIEFDKRFITYESDKMGNWIQQNIYIEIKGKKKPLYIIERDIEYFE